MAQAIESSISNHITNIEVIMTLLSARQITENDFQTNLIRIINAMQLTQSYCRAQNNYLDSQIHIFDLLKVSDITI